MRKNLYLIWFALTLSGCASIELPNVKVCTVAGDLSAGANCAYTLSDDTEEMTIEEYLDFLSPSDDPPRAGALCQSAHDWTRIKTTLEQACVMLKKKCTKEMKAEVKEIIGRLDRLKHRSLL